MADERSSIANNILQRKAVLCGKKFLQTDFWARFKAEHGWKSLRVTDGGQGKDASSDVSVLTRQFGRAPLRFTLAYVPMAGAASAVKSDGGQKTAECEDETAGKSEMASYAKGCAAALISFAKSMKLPRSTLCVRFDVPIDFDTCHERDEFVRALPGTVRKSRVDIQPPDTVLLDLFDGNGEKKSCDALLAAMKSKWRYNIRLAQKKGVAIKSYRRGDGGLSGALDIFYGLYEDTARRDKIAIHPKKYYGDLLDIETGEEGQVVLYTAEHESDNLAAIICVFTGSEAVYLYGASGNIKRNLMSTYLLQWQAIKDALSFGCKVYDFYGIPPAADRCHPMAGLYLFKTGFGGREVHRPGSIDVPLSPLYGLYTAAENARAFWYKKVRKAFSLSRARRGAQAANKEKREKDNALGTVSMEKKR